MQKKSQTIKILLPIQSISDIITNSSSEIFAYIHSKNHLKPIYSIINTIFGRDQESEMTPCVYLRNKKDYDEWRYYPKSKEYMDSFPDHWVEIELPYDMSGCEEFYREGLEAILDKRIGNNNYVIIYNED